MDDFGTWTGTAEDVSALAQEIRDKGNVLFSYSPNQVDCYIISINRDFSILGEIPFGGNPRGRYLVSVLGRGFFHFDLGGNTFHTQPSYVAEKLNLSSTDATYVSELLLGINARLVTIPF